MKAIELRHLYAETLQKRGHVQLPEHPIVNRSGDGPYFNGSALTPNIGYFLGTSERPSNALFTQQRVFWTRYADLQDLPPTPVWTIFQVMMSYYLFEQSSLQHALTLGYELLTDVLGISRHDVFVLTPDRADLVQMARRTGVLAENQVAWKRTPQFQVDDKLSGFYCKMLVRHKHGLLPLLDLINIEGADGSLMVDSCLLLERMTFVLQDKVSWYETELFLPLMQAIEAAEGGHLAADRYLYQFAALVRSIVAALADGAEISSKGKGYVVKKLLRQTLLEKARYGYRVRLPDLVKPSLVCLQHVGYTWTDAAEQIEEIFRMEEQTFDKWFTESECFLRKQVQLLESGKRDLFTREDLEQWKDSRGVPYEVAVDLLAARGQQVVGYAPKVPPTQRFFTEAYPYETDEPIADVRQWLIDFGAGR